MRRSAPVPDPSPVVAELWRGVKGRFRDFLKTSLYHLVIDAQARRRPLPLTDDVPEPPGPAATPVAGDDAAFLTIWREELMRRAWAALEAEERRSGQPVHTVLRFRTDQPGLTSPQAPERLSERLGKPVSAEWVRKWVHLARLAFARLLVDDVARSLDGPSRDDWSAS